MCCIGLPLRAIGVPLLPEPFLCRPSLFILVGIRVVYVRLGSLPWIAAMFVPNRCARLIFLSVQSFISYLVERFLVTYSLSRVCDHGP